MKKTILLHLSLLLVVVANAQSFQCPNISYRNNGNNSACPGEQVTKNGVTTTPVAVNSGLSASSYTIPTTNKEGTITMEFDQKYSDVPTMGSVSSAGSKLNVEFGPPSNWTTKTTSYALDYCFYNMDLPAAGKLFVMVINKGYTGTSYGTCTYDGQTLVNAPTINTQPTGQLNICKGSNYTFSCSATANGNNTNLSYQWKKNGTAISGATSSSLALTSVTNSNNGDYIVVVTETYTNGNAIQQESNVAKLSVDAIKPIVLTQNLTVNPDASGSASITASQINNGSTDNCTISSFTLDKTSFNCTNLGPNTVVLTVTDNNDNSQTATATVTVRDLISPVAHAKNYTTYIGANGIATIEVANIENGSTDNCSVTSKSLSKTSFDCSNLGDNTVTLTVSDASGNTNSTTATVTVVDAIAPVAKAKNYTVNLDANGSATITVANIEDGSTDNCSVTSKSLSKTSFDCNNLGDNIVTLSVEDASGNKGTATATVTVVDAIAPVAKAKNYTVNLDASGSATITVANIEDGSTDNCSVTSKSLSKTSFDCSNLGDNTVTLIVSDASGNTNSTTATVKVVDAIAPVAKAKNYTVNLDASGSATITVANIENGSTDNCSVVKSALDNYTFDCNNLGDNTVTLTVEDASGNKGTATATVKVVDAIAPVANAKNYTVNLDANGSATITVANIEDGSTDNCSVTSKSLSKTSFDCNNLGDNTVTLTVEDASGNKGTATATVKVVDAIAPVANAKNYTVNLDANGSATITVANIEDGSTDNCSVTSKSLSKTSFDCSNRGDNTVTLTVSDAAGNTNSTTATVTVVDNTKPTVLTKDATVYLDGAGKVSISTSDINYGSTDNCSFTLSLDKTDFVCTDKGAQTVTLTATDASGNKGTATATVTVVDNTKPIVQTKDVEISISNGADVTIVASDINNGSTDNCGITKYTLTGDKTKFGCSDRGKSFTVTLTAEDASGNSASATATVTVKGSLTQAPVITTDWKGLNNDGNYYYPYHSDKAKFSTTTKTGYTYSWSGNDISGSKTESYVYLLPTKEGKITLTATAKDADGCTASSNASLCVFDVAVPNTSNSKVYVCHDKGSNSVGASGFVTLEVSISGAKSHLTQHSKDKIGASCGTFDCTKLSSRSKSIDENTVVGQLIDMGDHMSVVVYPNPSNDVFIIELESEVLTSVSQVVITDMAGRVVETASMNPNIAIEVGRELIPGIYNIQVRNGGLVSISRLIKR